MSHCSLKIALAQLQKPLTDAAVSVELEGMEEVENSFSLDLSFSTGNVRTRHLREMRNAAAKISKVKLQLVPQPLTPLTTCLCSQVYWSVPGTLSFKRQQALLYTTEVCPESPAFKDVRGAPAGRFLPGGVYTPKWNA